MTRTRPHRGRGIGTGHGIGTTASGLLTAILVLLGTLAGPVAMAGAAEPENLALTAAPEANYTAPWNSLAAINDGAIGTGLGQMWGDYQGERPADGWLSYHWDSPVSISRSALSFWRDAPAAGTGENVWTPKSWKLQYKSAQVTEWTDVPGADAYGLSVTAPNVTTFPALTVTDVRAFMLAYPNADASAYSALSVPEWEVWGTPSAGPPASATDPVAVDEVHLPTTVGTVPTLPGSVPMTYQDGQRTAVPVSWPAITAAQVARPGTFTVSGTASGVSNQVSATIYVRAAGDPPALTGFLPMSALTVAGVAPQLPGVVLAQYADGSVDSRVQVSWDTPDPADYAVPGFVTVAGTVAGTDLRPEITVFVDEPAGAGGAPIVRLSAQPETPATGWSTGPVTVQITAASDTDPRPVIQYRVDDGAWQADGSEVRVESDGQHTVTARATDAAGAVSAERSVSFAIDATAPATQATTADRPDSVEVTLTAADAGSGAATIQYQVGDGFIATYAGSPIGIVKLDRPQTVRYFATDKAGNIEPTRTLEVPAAVAANGTTTTVALSDAAVAVGRRVTATVSVTGRSGQPAGVVVLRAGETELGRAALVHGKARVPMSTLDLTPGVITLTADYLGEGQDGPSSATAPLTLSAAGSTTTVTLSRAEVGYGSAVTARIRVTAPSVTPTGSLQVKEGDTVLGTGTLAVGRTIVQVPVLTPGTHRLTISYLGDTRVAPSSADAVLTVVAAPTKLAAVLSPTTLTSRAQTTVTATVTSSIAGVVPTGTVQVLVRQGGRQLLARSGSLTAGRAGIVLPLLPAGTYEIAVEYPGSVLSGPSSATMSAVVAR